jgi:hypothetical protein
MLKLYALHVKSFHSFKFYLLEAECVYSGSNQPWMQDKLDFCAEFADTCGQNVFLARQFFKVSVDRELTACIPGPCPCSGNPE